MVEFTSQSMAKIIRKRQTDYNKEYQLINYVKNLNEILADYKIFKRTGEDMTDTKTLEYLIDIIKTLEKENMIKFCLEKIHIRGNGVYEDYDF